MIAMTPTIETITAVGMIATMVATITEITHAPPCRTNAKTAAIDPMPFSTHFVLILQEDSIKRVFCDTFLRNFASSDKVSYQYLIVRSKIYLTSAVGGTHSSTRYLDDPLAALEKDKKTPKFSYQYLTRAALPKAIQEASGHFLWASDEFDAALSQALNLSDKE
uniref:Uncharacterized protein n=1 Tax=Romanomermis culicivorax TaxID=13658 RepID=A0A915IL04_ROMCU